MIEVVIVALVALPVLALAVAALTGRVRVQPCCAPDPADDLRMRGAFEDDEDLH